MLMQCTAGLFGGDDLECTIRVASGARVLLTQQSATKVHPSGDRPAIQRTRVFVGEGAELLLYQEPIIPFAESYLQQSTLIEVERGGRLVFWEALMAGRVGRGERWQFRALSSETRVSVNGRPVFLDRILLSPDGSQGAPLVMGCCSYAGTGLYVGEREKGAFLATALHEALPEAGVEALVPGVVLTRIVASTGPDFHRWRAAFTRVLSAEGLAFL
jgi:urease accessory protein